MGIKWHGGPAFLLHEVFVVERCKEHVPYLNVWCGPVAHLR